MTTMKQSERLGIRISPAEKEAWKRRAAEAGMSVSEYIKTLVRSAAE